MIYNLINIGFYIFITAAIVLHVYGLNKLSRYNLKTNFKNIAFYMLLILAIALKINSLN